MTRGGKRKGAGRPPLAEHLKRKRVSIRLPGWLADWLLNCSDQGRLVERALIETFELSVPEEEANP